MPPIGIREYELLICTGCGREKVCPAAMTNVVRCFCGAEEWELYDLVPMARDIDERYQLAEEETHDALTA